MENISKAAQKEIVGQVLDEMKEIEKIAIKDWNATWEEHYTNAYCKYLLEQNDVSYQMINDIEKENNNFGLDSIDLIENKIDDELRVIKGEIPSNKLIDNIYFTINSRKLPNYYDEYRPNMLKKQAKKQSHTR